MIVGAVCGKREMEKIFDTDTRTISHLLNNCMLHASIPNESDYLKVVHDAKHPRIAEEVCEKGGETLLKTLGWRISVLVKG